MYYLCVFTFAKSLIHLQKEERIHITRATGKDDLSQDLIAQPNLNTKKAANLSYPRFLIYVQNG